MIKELEEEIANRIILSKLAHIGLSDLDPSKRAYAEGRPVLAMFDAETRLMIGE